MKSLKISNAAKRNISFFRITTWIIEGVFCTIFLSKNASIFQNFKLIFPFSTFLCIFIIIIYYLNGKDLFEIKTLSKNTVLLLTLFFASPVLFFLLYYEIIEKNILNLIKIISLFIFSSMVCNIIWPFLAKIFYLFLEIISI